MRRVLVTINQVLVYLNVTTVQLAVKRLINDRLSSSVSAVAGGYQQLAVRRTCAPLLQVV